MRLRFTVTFLVQINNNGIPSDPEEITQLTHGEEKEGITLISGNCNYIPEIILHNAPSSNLMKEEKGILLRYGFVKYMEIKEEEYISINLHPQPL